MSVQTYITRGLFKETTVSDYILRGFGVGAEDLLGGRDVTRKKLTQAEIAGLKAIYGEKITPEIEEKGILGVESQEGIVIDLEGERIVFPLSPVSPEVELDAEDEFLLILAIIEGHNA